MPLKLHVGLSRKLGLPDYGSLGATCHLELELDQRFLERDLEGFHQQVRNAYTVCRQAVQDELARQQREGLVTGEPASRSNQSADPAPENGQRSSARSGSQASSKQLSYIQQLARQIDGLDPRQLDELASRMCGQPVRELSSFEASAVIDQLKAIKAGQVSLDAALGKGAAA